MRARLHSRAFHTKISIYNHPLSALSSSEDLCLLVDYKVKNFRTYGKNGVYVLEYNEQINTI